MAEEFEFMHDPESEMNELCYKYNSLQDELAGERKRAIKLKCKNRELDAKIQKGYIDQITICSDRNILFLLVCKLVSTNSSFKYFGIRKSSIENDSEWPVVCLQLEGFDEISFHFRNEEIKDLNLPIIDVPHTDRTPEQNFQRLLNIYHTLVV